MLVRNPTDAKTPFVVTLNIDACYEGIIAEIGMLFITFFKNIVSPNSTSVNI
jgi:hypothetical protein